MALRKHSALERRLKEIEREKTELRARLQEVRRRTDESPVAAQLAAEPRLRDAAVPAGYRGDHPARRRNEPAVFESDAAAAPEGEISLDFEPAPDGLDTKRVVMPRLQRTDLLRPAIGGTASSARLMEPEHDRFRNYFGSAGLKRVREARREPGSQRARTVFMVLMVATLSFILFKMIT